MTVETRIKDLHITLPELSSNELPYSLGVKAGNLITLSGQTPRVNGEQRYKGILGTGDISIEEAQEAARICVINLLGALKAELGDLNKVKRIVKMKGYVAADHRFTDHSKVINAASDLLNDIFGIEDKHARVAIGVASLPGGAPVEIEMIAEIE